MKLFHALLIAMAATLTAPLAVAAAPVDPVPVCVFDPTLWTGMPGNACVDVDTGSNPCVTVYGGVSRQHVAADVSTPGESVTTKPVNAGPVHVGSTTVTLDPVHVVSVDQWTPGRTFSNRLCA